MNIMNTKEIFALLQNIFLLLVRVAVSFAMLSHGFPKLQMLLEGGDIQFYNFLGLNSTISLTLTIFAEFVCSIFIILGLFTRWATFFLIFTMAFAAFIYHSGDPFDKKELSILYLCVYLLLFVFQAGKFSIDAMIKKRKQARAW